MLDVQSVLSALEALNQTSDKSIFEKANALLLGFQQSVYFTQHSCNLSLTVLVARSTHGPFAKPFYFHRNPHFILAFLPRRPSEIKYVVHYAIDSMLKIFGRLPTTLPSWMSTLSKEFATLLFGLWAYLSVVRRLLLSSSVWDCLGSCYSIRLGLMPYRAWLIYLVMSFRLSLSF